MNWYIYIRCHERQQRETNEKQLLNKKVVDENITKCYIDKVASAVNKFFEN